MKAITGTSILTCIPPSLRKRVIHVLLARALLKVGGTIAVPPAYVVVVVVGVVGVRIWLKGVFKLSLSQLTSLYFACVFLRVYSYPRLLRLTFCYGQDH